MLYKMKAVAFFSWLFSSETLDPLSSDTSSNDPNNVRRFFRDVFSPQALPVDESSQERTSADGGFITSLLVQTPLPVDESPEEHASAAGGFIRSLLVQDPLPIDEPSESGASAATGFIEGLLAKEELPEDEPPAGSSSPPSLLRWIFSGESLETCNETDTLNDQGNN